MASNPQICWDARAACASSQKKHKVVLAAASGCNPIDANALGYLVDRHAAALELYARGWCDTPEDIVQDAFLQLVRQKEPPRQVVPWLYRVVRNRAISELRSKYRRKKHEQNAGGEADPWFRDAEESRLDGQTAAAALRKLAADQREVIVAHLWGGLTFEQIAELTGSSTSTAHRRYHAGLESLRIRLGISWPTEHPTIRS